MFKTGKSRNRLVVTKAGQQRHRGKGSGCLIDTGEYSREVIKMFWNELDVLVQRYECTVAELHALK